MKKDVLYLLCLVSLLTSCQTPTAEKIAKYVGRPKLGNSCIANNDGTCWEAGELRSVENMICAPAPKWNEAQEHLERMEYFMYRCLKWDRCEK